MAPDRVLPARDIFSHLDVALRDQGSSLPFSEPAEAAGKTINAALIIDNAVPTQHRSWITANDLLIIFELTEVRGQKRARYLPSCCSATAFEQSADHYRLVDVAHCHFFFEKASKPLERNLRPLAWPFG